MQGSGLWSAWSLGFRTSVHDVGLVILRACDNMGTWLSAVWGAAEHLKRCGGPNGFANNLVPKCREPISIHLCGFEPTCRCNMHTSALYYIVAIRDYRL